MTFHFPDKRHRRVPITCGTDGCEEVLLVHWAHEDNVAARGWLCPDHQPPDLDPELQHKPGCKGGRSIATQADESVRHRCPGCNATRSIRPPRDPRTGGTR